MAVILGLPALLQAIATIGVGGAIGYKAQKDLKDSNIDIRNLEDPQIKMLRAMLMPTQTVGQEIKDRLFKKDEAEKKDEPEKKEEKKPKIEFQIKPKPQSRPPEPPKQPEIIEEIIKDVATERAIKKADESTEKLFKFIKDRPFGFTADLEGNEETEGFVVAETKLTEIALPQKELTRDTVRKFAQNLKRLSDATERDIKAGGWFNEDDGKYYLDGPVIYDTLEEALYAGDAGEQLAIFDLKNVREIKTKEGIEELKKAGTYDSKTADVFRRNREKLDKRLREIGVQDQRQSEEKLRDQLEDDMNFYRFNDEPIDFTKVFQGQTEDSKKIKNIDDAMTVVNVYNDNYIDLIDKKIEILDKDDPERKERPFNILPEGIKNKIRAQVDPGWAEANFGEEYMMVLDKARSREIDDSIPKGIRERTVMDDIDDMNKANLEELFEGKKKN